MDIKKTVIDQLARLGCTGGRAIISVAESKEVSGYVLVWDPEYDPECSEPVDVNPEFLAGLLRYLTDDAPIGECESDSPSVWDVIMSLSMDGYTKTLIWLQEEHGLVAKAGA